MDTRPRTIDTLRIASLILVLAAMMFAMPAGAQTSDTEGSTEADLSAPQDVPEADLGVAEEAPGPSVTGSREKSWRQKRQARQQARAEAYRQRLAARKQAGPQEQAAPEAPLGDIKVLFKLDPRLTRSLYMGERWVSSSSGVQEGEYTVEARVQGLDAKGRPVDISPEWQAADPEMVTVSPGQGKEVTITVKRAGQSTLRVTSQGVSKDFVVTAKYPNNTHIQAEISQKPGAPAPATAQPSSGRSY